MSVVASPCSQCIQTDPQCPHTHTPGADVRRLISDGVIVDKSVFEQRFAYKVAQVMRTDTSAAFDSFASRWRRNPLKERLPHMLPRVSRKR